jgi:lipopolysaccharide export system permease protein
MNTFFRYFSFEFFKLLSICLIIFTTVFLIGDFVQKIDDFMSSEVPFVLTAAYFIYKIPYVIVQMMPVATLISVIILFCIMIKNNEIVAMKACGMNVIRPLLSVVIMSLIVSFFVFWVSESVVPVANSKSTKIWRGEVRKKELSSFYGGNQIWCRSGDAIYWIKHFDKSKNIMLRPTFYFFGKEFELSKRIDGKIGIWENGVWKIREGIIQEIYGDGDYKLAKFDELYLDIPETPETFVKVARSPDDMSYHELKRFAEEVQQEGYDNTQYIVDLNTKRAFPLISFILAIIGIPLAFRLQRRGLPLAITAGIGLCFLYIMTMSFSKSLGASGALPPLIAAWAANLIFLFLGLHLFANIER